MPQNEFVTRNIKLFIGRFRLDKSGKDPMVYRYHFRGVPDTMQKGTSFNVSVEVEHTHAESPEECVLLDNTGILWSSTDPSTASVDDNGKVTLNECGQCEIVAATDAGEIGRLILSFGD